MANTTLTADIIAKEALMILENELGWINKLHRAHEEEFAQQVNGYKAGETISIRRPADPQVRRGAVATPSDIIEGKISMTVDQQVGTDFKFTSTDLTLKISDLSERVIKPAMSNIINDVAADLLAQMYVGAHNWVGTPGTVINGFPAFSKGPQRLDHMAVPNENRCAIITIDDHWSLAGAATVLANTGVENTAYRKGEIGMIGGVSTYMSQVTPTHIAGARGGAPAVNGANQSVLYDTVKNTYIQTLNIDGATAGVAGWATAGDVFTIAGVFMVNPKTKAPTAILHQFTVVTTVASGAGAFALTISPPIIASGPHRNVTAAPADNAVLTFIGTAGAATPVNLVFHKNAMGLAVVPMESPQGAVNVSRQTYKGFSVRIIPTYDGVNDVSNWRLDMLYGRKLLDPRLLTRLSGT